MEVIPIVIIVLLLVSVVFCTKVYNSLVTLKHSVSKAWVNIESLLKQRHDQLAKLVELCKKYNVNEPDLIDRLMSSRTQVMNAQQMGEVTGLAAAERQIQPEIKQLVEITQANPELLEDENFQRVRGKLVESEQAILDRADAYNRCVIASNDRIEQFPYNFIASFFSFGSYERLNIKLDSSHDTETAE